MLWLLCSVMECSGMFQIVMECFGMSWMFWNVMVVMDCY